MRSTRATAAVTRLNTRSKDNVYSMARTSAGLFYLSNRVDGDYKRASEDLMLEDFVRFVDALGPQQVRRITKNDAAFAKQLIKKS